MKKVVLYIFFGVCLTVSSQSKEEKANAYYEDYKFEKAIKLYSDLASGKKRPSLEVVQRLADSYFNMNRYQEAVIWYKKLYNIMGKEVGEGNIIKLVQSLKASMHNERADQLLKDFYTDEDRLQMMLSQKVHLDSTLAQKEKYATKNMAFNSTKSDFGPMLFNDGLVFASARDTTKSNGELYPWNKQPYLDLYITRPNITGLVPEKYLENLESSYHDATLTFSWDGQTVYFTRNYLKKKNRLSANEDGLSHMQILRGTIRNNELVDVISLGFNSKEYSCGHPALSSDGRYLYFTSNMPGGFGESDIYVVDLSNDGVVLSDPMNLGPTINTRGREMFPYIHNKMLYFSSDSHYGLGGLDIFSSTIFSKTDYSLPLNMGKPLNSNLDDFSFIYENKKGEGYFASNRKGGRGDDDIYRFRKVKPTGCLEYSGYVLNKQTGKPVANANLEIKNTTGEIISIYKTDESGYYQVLLSCKKKNTLVFSRAGASKETVIIQTGENSEAVSTDNIVYLTPFDSLVEKEGDMEKIKVNPIYFEYDKYDITASAKIELEKVLFAMQTFPEIRIKIESHTDARGRDDYNLELSENRAKSTRRYLLLKGIDADRIESAYGYGEYRLKNECKNNVKCSDQKHLENRRSNFIIVSRQADEIINAKK
ncbi:OmpA family protein [Zobellia sp.]|nr:OmpA family protein [Zobellia sp.]